jgi:enoyl-CoA hydratase
MMTGRVELSMADGVGRIILARPEKHNAITREMALELARICREIDANDKIRVATITGAGERAFSAGSDLNGLADLSEIWAFRNRVEYAAVVRDIR